MTDLVYTTGINAMGKKWIDHYKLAVNQRSPLEADWRNVARFGLPRHYSGWTMQNVSPQVAGSGAARQARIDSFDSTLARSLRCYQAVLERMLTPGTKRYHILRPQDERARRQRSIMLYAERLNRELFTKRYNPHSMFVQTQSAGYTSIGAYGNAGKMITWRKAEPRFSRAAGFTYRDIPFRDLFWIESADGIIRTWFRRIWWTAKQACDELGDKCPKDIQDKAKTQAANDVSQSIEFVHIVTPSEDYDGDAFDRRRYPLVSLYIYVKDAEIVRDAEGFRSNPLVTPRLDSDGTSGYGYSPAQLVLASVGVANAQKRTELRYGQRASEPPLLTKDDGVIPDLRPGKTTPGGIDGQGRKMVQPIDLGNWQVNEKSLEATQADIRDPLFGRIFDIVKDRPQRSVPEVLDDIGREAALLAPTMGRLQTEDIAMMIEREIALLAENDALPDDMPKEFADQEIEFGYTSPMALAMQSESVGNYYRMLQTTAEVAKMTGDTSTLDHFALDRALPDIAELQAIAPSWMASDDEIAAKRDAKKQAQQAEQVTKALPGVASLARSATDNQMKPPTQ